MTTMKPCGTYFVDIADGGLTYMMRHCRLNSGLRRISTSEDALRELKSLLLQLDTSSGISQPLLVYIYAEIERSKRFSKVLSRYPIYSPAATIIEIYLVVLRDRSKCSPSDLEILTMLCGGSALSDGKGNVQLVKSIRSGKLLNNIKIQRRLIRISDMAI